MSKPINSPLGRYRAVISGFGSFAPKKKLTNADLSQMVDTSDEWITTRTGIKTRHITSDNETTAFLATEASKRALAVAFSVLVLSEKILSSTSPCSCVGLLYKRASMLFRKLAL